MKKKVSEVIREYLSEKGIMQEYLVNKTSISSSKLSDVLNGKRKLTADEFIEIVIALGIDPNYVINKVNSVD